MKIKTKLIAAFIIIILVPVGLVPLFGVILSRKQVRLIEENYDIDTDGYEDVSNPIILFNKLTMKNYHDIAKATDETPEKFEKDKDYLERLNEKLSKKYSFLIVRKGSDIIYNGDETNNKIVDNLPRYGNYNYDSENGIYLGGEIQNLVKQKDFLFPDGSEGSIFIAIKINNLVPQVKTFIYSMITITILILIATSGLLIAWIYKSVVKPIRILQEATHKITEGNLNFTLKINGSNEICELYGDFEEMRIRLKESANEKLDNDKEGKELISNISHDLKTPITAIKGYVEGILDGVADTPEKIDKYIKTIYIKANDMERLIDELTFYSKIDTNKIPYTFGKINIDRYFRDCVEELSLDLEAQHIDITYFNYADENIMIIADPEQLKKVINNVIGNSVKYIGDKKGVINVRIKDVGDFVQVEIEDNGKGISVKDLPHIFDRFYRTDASRNSLKGGSGIGLSIVKKIMEDHGGKVWATSKESTGTVMFIVFRKYQEEVIYE